METRGWQGEEGKIYEGGEQERTVEGVKEKDWGSVEKGGGWGGMDWGGVEGGGVRGKDWGGFEKGGGMNNPERRWGGVEF